MLESLHDRRVIVTSLFARGVSDAKLRRVDVAMKNDVDALRRLVVEKIDQLRRLNDLGSNLDSVQRLIDATLELQRDASDIERRCVACVTVTEGTNLSDLAGGVLKNATAYLKMIEQRYSHF